MRVEDTLVHRPGSSSRARLSGCAGCLVLLAVAFSGPLATLAARAAGSELHSHIPLVPLVTALLLYARRAALPGRWRTSIAGAVVPGGVALAALAAGAAWRQSISMNDYLALMVLACLCLVAAICFLFLGSAWMRAAAFPFAFLIFMVPLPDALVTWLENLSAAASAEAAAVYFAVAGTSVVRHGATFELTGIVLEVAQECSGIRSSLVLFIASVLASHLCLRTTWRRVALVALVIPLGILRNGLRIVTIGLLSVHVSPDMIHGAIHRRGGPVFFALSLVPLFLLLWWLRRQELRPRPRTAPLAVHFSQD